MSHGDTTGAGGGALTAFTFISAAEAIPVSAITVATDKANFFIFAPHRSFGAGRSEVRFGAPTTLGLHNLRPAMAGSKAENGSRCHLFRRFGVFAKCCFDVWHLGHNFVIRRGACPGLGEANRADTGCRSAARGL